MVVCKILWVCAAVVAMNARESQSNVLLDSSKDCTCFPTNKDSIRVSKLAKKYRMHERKVVYLFKNPDTLEVSMYVPNEEKQLIFPDLMVDSFEFYGLPKSEHLYQIFTDPSTMLPVVDHSNSITTNYIDLSVPSKHHDVSMHPASTGPKHHDVSMHPASTGPKHHDVSMHPASTGPLEILHHKVPTGMGEKGTNYVVPGTGDKNLLLELHKHPNSGDQSGRPIIQVVDDVNLVKGYEKIVAEYLKRPKQHVMEGASLISGHGTHGNLNHDNHVHNHVDDIHIGLEHNNKILDIYDKITSPLDGNVEKINIIIGPDNQHPSNLNKNTKNVNQDTIGLHIVDTVLPNKLVPDETKVTQKPYHILDNTMLDTGFNFVKSVQELLSGNKNNAIPASLNLKLANSPVLDKWLVEEINQVGNSGPGTSSPDTVDLLEIKVRLLYVLEQNGLRFTENGDLSDVHGHVFKISNLKLRRVMISDPVVYQKLLGGHKCVTPYDIPYLEAVFVSLVYPPKVLGLIPLKLSTLPRCKGGKCKSKMCASKKETHLKGHLKVPHKLNLAPIYNTKFKTDGLLLPRMDSGEETEDVSQMLPHMDPDVTDGHDHHEGDDKTPPGDGDDDGLGIRIIGGHPATSSGTPVSSKGRSGHKE